MLMVLIDFVHSGSSDAVDESSSLSSPLMPAEPRKRKLGWIMLGESSDSSCSDLSFSRYCQIMISYSYLHDTQYCKPNTHTIHSTYTHTYACLYRLTDMPHYIHAHTYTHLHNMWCIHTVEPHLMAIPLLKSPRYLLLPLFPSCWAKLQVISYLQTLLIWSS